MQVCKKKQKKNLFYSPTFHLTLKWNEKNLFLKSLKIMITIFAHKKYTKKYIKLQFFLLFYSISKESEYYLYDPSLLLQLDFHRSPAKFKPFISAVAPGEPWLKVRPLKDGDFHRGFLQSLSQLTSIGKVSHSQFLSEYCIFINFFRVGL